jgi:hypothetical protein
MLRKGEQRGVRMPLGTMTAGLGGESVEDEPLLPKFDYYIDESDPDILVLRRQDRAFAAAFSAQGTTREGIVEAAREDYRRLLEAHLGSVAPKEDERRRSI